jgi:hypothetical protein
MASVLVVGWHTSKPLTLVQPCPKPVTAPTCTITSPMRTAVLLCKDFVPQHHIKPWTECHLHCNIAVLLKCRVSLLLHQSYRIISRWKTHNFMIFIISLQAPTNLNHQRSQLTTQNTENKSPRFQRELHSTWKVNMTISSHNLMRVTHKMLDQHLRHEQQQQAAMTSH